MSRVWSLVMQILVEVIQEAEHPLTDEVCSIGRLGDRVVTACSQAEAEEETNVLTPSRSLENRGGGINKGQ